MVGVKIAVGILACALLAASCNADLPGSKAPCDVCIRDTGYDSIRLKFTIPSVKTPVASTIHRVNVQFQFDSDILAAGQVKVLPPDQRGQCSTPCTGFSFSNFYPTATDTETDSSDDNVGYLLRLRNRSGGLYELEIRNKMDGPTTWGTWSDEDMTREWSVTITGLSGSHTFSVVSVQGFDKDNALVTDTAFTTDLEFTSIDTGS